MPALRNIIYVFAAALTMGCSSSVPVTYTVGEFSFDYPAQEFEMAEEEQEGEMTSFILYDRKRPFNRIEFAIFRYTPEFVSTIIPSELMGELKADVISMSKRATVGLDITSQDGRISPEGFPNCRTVDNLMTVSDTTGTSAFLRVTSTQLEHYNIILVAWAVDKETMDSYMDIYSSFRVKVLE